MKLLFFELSNWIWPVFLPLAPLIKMAALGVKDTKYSALNFAASHQRSTADVNKKFFDLNLQWRIIERNYQLQNSAQRLHTRRNCSNCFFCKLFYFFKQWIFLSVLSCLIKEFYQKKTPLLSSAFGLIFWLKWLWNGKTEHYRLFILPTKNYSR